MTRKNQNIEVLEKILEIVKEEKSKKVTMKYLIERMKKLGKELKDISKEKNKGKKLTEYNIFVKENMEKVKKENPNMSNNERMTHIGKLWREKKEKDMKKNKTKKCCKT